MLIGSYCLAPVPSPRQPLHPRSQPGSGPGRRGPSWRTGSLRELGLVVLLFGLYKAGRVLAAQHVGAAFDNADDIWQLERWLHLPSEITIQQWVLQSLLAVKASNAFYAWVHFPATAAFLLWLYVRRPAYYPWARWAMAGLTAAALLLHLAVPLAPPRMLGDLGFVDTAAEHGPAVYGQPGPGSLADQYAAMPSLHVGWAVMVAVGLIVATRSRWRWLWLAHPVITTMVVVATGNHFWLDGVLAIVLLGIVLLVLPQPAARPSRMSERETDLTRSGTPGAPSEGDRRLLAGGGHRHEEPGRTLGTPEERVPGPAERRAGEREAGVSWPPTTTRS